MDVAFQCALTKMARRKRAGLLQLEQEEEEARAQYGARELARTNLEDALAAEKCSYRLYEARFEKSSVEHAKMDKIAQAALPARFRLLPRWKQQMALIDSANHVERSPHRKSVYGPCIGPCMDPYLTLGSPIRGWREKEPKLERMQLRENWRPNPDPNANA